MPARRSWPATPPTCSRASTITCCTTWVTSSTTTALTTRSATTSACCGWSTSTATGRSAWRRCRCTSTSATPPLRPATRRGGSATASAPRARGSALPSPPTTVASSSSGADARTDCAARRGRGSFATFARRDPRNPTRETYGQDCWTPRSAAHVRRGARACARGRSAPTCRGRAKRGARPGCGRREDLQLVREAVGSDQTHEARAGQHTNADRRASALGEQHHLLVTAAADRLHEPAVLDELLDQRGGHLGKSGGDNDRVVRRVLGEPERPVTDHHVRVPDPVAGEVRTCGVGEI